MFFPYELSILVRVKLLGFCLSLIIMDRFLEAQKSTFKQALTEVQHGKKETHWMWFIFPQLDGITLNPSEMNKKYSLTIEEAKLFLAHRTLGSRLRKITQAIETSGKTIKEIFGTDSEKLRSSMTLFDLISPNSIFAKILNSFFQGKRDLKTESLCKME
jgi:uncharacterized protein (DUF1810 family)